MEALILLSFAAFLFALIMLLFRVWDVVAVLFSMQLKRLKEKFRASLAGKVAKQVQAVQAKPSPSSRIIELENLHTGKIDRKQNISEYSLYWKKGSLKAGKRRHDGRERYMLQIRRYDSNAERRLFVWGAKGKTFRYDLGEVALEKGKDMKAMLSMSLRDAEAIIQRDFPMQEKAPVVGKAKEAPKVEAEAASAPKASTRSSTNVIRGRIIDSGVWERDMDDKKFHSFGVKYESDGKQQIAWGVDLERAMAEAGVQKGDSVEILKMGKKKIDKNKAPMNVYQIVKLNPAN